MGYRGAIPYKKIEQLYVIPSKVEGSIPETPHHRLTTEHFFQNRNPFVASDISAQGTPIKGALAGESPQGEAEGVIPSEIVQFYSCKKHGENGIMLKREKLGD